MKKAQLKELLFERFQKRIDEIVKKRKQFQEEIDGMTKDLIHEYGPLAIAALRDMEIHLPGGAKKAAVPAVAEPESPAAEQPAAEPEKKIRRRRKSRKDGEETITQILERVLPKVLEVVGAGGKEFTSREAFDHLERDGLPDKRLNSGHVSLLLKRLQKQLGLKCVSKKIKVGNSPSKATNFFSFKKG